MPSGKLDAKTVEGAKPRATKYRLSDGGGLLLEVVPTGAKVWLARVTVAGKRRDHGLGGWPAVTLAQARQKALAARREALSGADPVKARHDARKALEAARKAEEEAERRRFENVLEEVIRAEAPSWKNARTPDMWRASLRLHAAPLMAKPVAAITREMVADTIAPIWHEKPVIAGKTLRRIGAVLRFAAAHGWRPNDNVTDVKLLRNMGLTAQAGGAKQASLPWQQVPAFMEALQGMAGMAPIALRFVVLTALRSGEARAARWDWLSFDGTPALIVPGANMKGRKTVSAQSHRVPLSAAALQALADAYGEAHGVKVALADLPKLARLAGQSLIFPNQGRTAPLTDMAISAVIKRMNEDEGGARWRDPDGRAAVPHGFRSSFRTWCDDCHPGEREAAEKALAHEDASKVAGRYRRSDLFDRRIGLMAAWGEHCTKKPNAVVPIGKARAKVAR
jgi:integrase